MNICRKGGTLAAMAAFVLAATPPAVAGVSPRDGYAPDGSYDLRVELAPYIWVPAVSGDAKLGNGASLAFSQGIPSVSKLRNVLTGAFMGDARLRYGPWSAELNIQYVGASQTRSIAPDILGVPRSVNMMSNMTRVAPGVGYQVYSGSIGSVPATVDARAGFAWFGANATLKLNRFLPSGTTRVAEVSDSGSFAQPWIGFRGAIYPWERWRFELAALGQGFGVGGAWGWGATVSASWAATDWLNLIAAFAANNNSRPKDNGRVLQSLSMTAYGPLLGVSFTF